MGSGGASLGGAGSGGGPAGVGGAYVPGAGGTSGGLGGASNTGGIASADPCSLAPDVGPCDAAIGAYYFDTGMGACLPFSYGGCGGNANRFSTFDECLQSCGPAEACPLWLPGGPCSVAGDVVCLYDSMTTCLCQGTVAYSTCAAMPECATALGALEPTGSEAFELIAEDPNDIGGASIAMLIPPSMRCSCSSGTWMCVY